MKPYGEKIEAEKERIKEGKRKTEEKGKFETGGVVNKEDKNEEGRVK